MRKRLFGLGLVVALAAAVAGTSLATTTKTQAKVLRMSIGAEPPSLDPGLATDTTSSNVLNQIMDPLVILGPPPALKPQPALAQSWSMKGTDVTINLRHDGRWTNGQPVTADDFVWSWLRTISPELGADYAYQFFGIQGAEAYNSCDPKKADCNALKAKVGISAPNKYTIKVKLASPQPWFIQQIAHTSFLPVNRSAVEKYGNKWTEAANIVTDGPFKLAAWKHDASLTLVKNDKWRNAKSVKLDRIELPIITDATSALSAFKAGNIDVDNTGFNPSDIAKLKKTPEWKQFQALGTYYYGFNVKNVTDANQRKAMAEVIDRKAIIKYITQAGQVPATGFTPKGIAGGNVIDAHNWLATSSKGKANVAKAKQLMAKVKNPQKNINLFLNNAPGHKEIAVAIQNYWQQLGISVNIKVQEWKQFLQFLGPPPNDQVSAYRLGWIADFPDAYNFLSLWTCKSGNNNTNWCNPKFDALIDKATKTPDADKRAQIYQQAEDMLTGPNGEMPVMPIYWYTFNMLVKKNVHGLFESPMGQYYLQDVSVS